MSGSIEDLADKIFDTNTLGLGDDKGNKKDSKGKGSSNNNNDQSKDGAKTKRPFTAYKYSNKSRAPLHEAAIVAGQAVFLTNENGSIRQVESIEESNRIIKPPNAEEYPYEPYEFASMEEVNTYLTLANQRSKDLLFKDVKSIVKKYNDQDDYKQILLAADIMWSYFQDQFSTTHYLGVVGGNSSGKSTIGDTFEAVGYRPVSMTDLTAANLFRVLGTIEPGQCTIIADEAEKIDQSSDMMGILKTGYHIKKKVAKINSNTWKQEFFWTYCFKMIIAERSPTQSSAKGVLDRMLIFNTYEGSPEHDIKEVLNPQGNRERQKLLNELLGFRKLMLIYRLVHFTEPIVDIDIGLQGRDKELCKPTIQLFYNTEAQEEVESALQKFIDLKDDRKKSSNIEAVLYPIIINSISKHGNEVSVGILWDSIKQEIEGTGNTEDSNVYFTSDYGPIYRNTITNILCDKFGAIRKHRGKGNVLIFIPEKVNRVGNIYIRNLTIQTKSIVLEHDDEGCECFTGSPMNRQPLTNGGNGKSTVQSYKNREDQPDIVVNIAESSSGQDKSITRAFTAFTAFTCQRNKL